MAPSDLDCARMCEAIHDDPKSVQWDHLFTSGLAFVGHKKWGAVDLIVWRGSYTGLDWFSDINAMPANWPGIGTVHAGFLGGVLWDAARVDAVCGKRVVICGHSLGAAHAQIYAAMRLSADKPAERIVVMGSPRPAAIGMRAVLSKTPITNYRNVGDPVTDVPGWPYIEMRDFTDLHVTPAQATDDFFARHHAANYVAGIAALNQPKE